MRSLRSPSTLADSTRRRSSTTPPPNAAAKLDEENAAFYWSEFAVQYARKAPVVMEQFLDDKTRDMIRQKALTYALKALGIEKEDAKRLL